MKSVYTYMKSLFLVAAMVAFPMMTPAQQSHAGHGHGAEEPVAKIDVHDDHGDDVPVDDTHADEVVLSSEAIRLFNITTEKAQLRTLSSTVTVPARISYNTEDMAHIGTQVQGRVKAIAVRLGDEVRQGDVLLTIDSPELGVAQSDYLQKQVAVEVADSIVQVAQTSVEVAQIAFERAEKLRESKGISVTGFLERQGAFRQAEADLGRTQAELKGAKSGFLAAENQLHILGLTQQQVQALLESGEISTSYIVRAPISGRVIEREVTPGEIVDPSDEALMVLAAMDDLWVLADVSENAISRVSINTPARLTMSALGDFSLQASVSYIPPHLDSRTRTASVRLLLSSDDSTNVEETHEPEEEDHSGHYHGEVDEHEVAGHEDEEAHELDEEDHSGHNDGEVDEHDDHEDGLSQSDVNIRDLLKPGMFGRAELQLSAMPGQNEIAILAVPEAAIQDIEGGPAVFVPVADEANTFALRPLKVGKRVGRWVPVLSGLSEDEEFVATSTFILKAELGKGGAGHGH